MSESKHTHMIYTLGGVKNGTGFHRSAHFLGAFDGLDEAQRAAKLAQLGEAALIVLGGAETKGRGMSDWNVEKMLRAEADRLGLPGNDRKTREEQDQPETPRQGVETPDDAQGRSPLVPALGDRPAGRVASPAVPPAPPGLEEQLRAIWRETPDGCEIHGLKRAATETPLARLGQLVVEHIRIVGDDFDAAHLGLAIRGAARALNLLPEPKDHK